MRTRSPRMAPPENGEDGSTASTADRGSSAVESLLAAMAISWSVRVDLPAPGAPVIPTV